jgi:hypothetical protein
VAIGHDSSMSTTENDLDTPLVDNIAFVSAAAACARYDENFQTIPNRDVVYTPAALRREALAIASLEGAGARKENLARLLGKRELTNVERGTRIALDIYDALKLVTSLGTDLPDRQKIIEIFEVSDASFGRVRRPEFLWSIENDAVWLQGELIEVEEKNDPWAWMEVIRTIFNSGRFSSTAIRMALLMAPICLAKAFDCRSPIFGTAEGVRRHNDEVREASTSAMNWASVFTGAVAAGVKAETGLIKEIAPGRATIAALCPIGRSTSSIGRAIDYMLGMPVFSMKTLAEALKVTDRGAKDIVDKLLDADLLEIEGGVKQNRLFICRRAL